MSDKPLQPITKELLDSMAPWDREVALRKYHEWVEKERGVDKGNVRRQLHRVKKFLDEDYRLKIKRYQKVRYDKTHDLKVKCKRVTKCCFRGLLFYTYVDVDGDVDFRIFDMESQTTK